MFRYLQARICATLLDVVPALIPLSSFEKPAHTRARTGIFGFVLRWHVSLASKTARTDRAFLDALRAVRLRKLLRLAKKTTFWGNAIARAGHGSDEDILRKLPIVSKSVLRPLPKTLFMTPRGRMLKDKLVWRFTSGSTGEPFSWGFEPHVVFLDFLAFFMQSVEESGFTWRDRTKQSICVLNFPDIDSHPLFPLSESLQWAPNSLSSEKDLDRLCSEIERLERPILFTYPPDLWLFIKAASKRTQKPQLGFVSTVGQTLEPEIRALAEEFFECPVRSFYSARDMFAIALECEKHEGRFHINEQHVIVEIVDDSGEPVAPGAWGKTVITALYNHAMPLLRYQIGDSTRFVEGSCECGLQLRSIELRGRETEFVELPTGQLSAHEIGVRILKLLFNRIRQYQIIQKHDGLTILLVPETIRLEDSLIQRLTESITDVVQSTVAVHVEQVTEIERHGGKFKRFIPLSQSTASSQSEA
jgi:phenylacetate-coenzyme A ligase PaaK-like adenylate-forming protein